MGPDKKPLKNTTENIIEENLIMGPDKKSL